MIKGLQLSENESFRIIFKDGTVPRSRNMAVNGSSEAGSAIARSNISAGTVDRSLNHSSLPKMSAPRFRDFFVSEGTI
jgi:hypothetical protein